MSRQLLDCSRLLCPMPVIRVQDAIATLQPGDELEAHCTDPGALKDIPAWARINGHDVLECRSDGDDHVVVLRVCEAAGQ